MCLYVYSICVVCGCVCVCVCEELWEDVDVTVPRKTLQVQVIFSVPTLPNECLQKEKEITLNICCISLVMYYLLLP